MIVAIRGTLFLLLVTYYVCNVGSQTLNPEEQFVFSNEYVGVEFSPYVNHHSNGTFPGLDSYSVENIKDMLQVVSTKFQRISTSGMGVNANNLEKNWNETESNCLITTAAAKLNAQNGSLLITVTQGIRISGDRLIGHQEIKNALLAAAYANQIFPGTVWGLTFIIESATAGEVIELYNIILKTKKVAARSNVKVGLKPPACDSASTQLRWTGLFLKFTRIFLSAFDYMLCIAKPSETDLALGPGWSARTLGEKYLDMLVNTRQVIYGDSNTSMPRIILEDVGWPTVGPTNTSSIPNMVIFWMEVGKWAQENKVLVHMHEAFDQPYRAEYNISDEIHSVRQYSPDAYCGWWRKAEDNNSYIEKIKEPREEFPRRQFESSISSTSSGNLPILILVPVVLLLIGVGLGMLTWKLLKGRKQFRRLTEAEIKEFKECSQGAESGALVSRMEKNIYSLPYQSRYEIPKSKFKIDKEVVIGEGAYGLVFKGQVEIHGNTEVVAIKTAKSTPSTLEIKSLLSELKLMTYVGSHPNIVRLVGAYTADIKYGNVYIAIEFCSKGSLEKLLRRSSFLAENDLTTTTGLKRVSGVREELIAHTDNTEAVSITQLNQWAFQVAEGMQYLTSKKVIHGDLATRNVLVANDDTVRISDFGLSRRLYEYTEYVKTSNEALPWRWMALESLTSLQFSTKSDVWAYGITIWEIYSMGDIPYPGLIWDIGFVEKLKEGIRMYRPEFATEIIFKKMEQCWKSDPEKRPSFDNLVDFFSPETMACTYLSIEV